MVWVSNINPCIPIADGSKQGNNDVVEYPLGRVRRFMWVVTIVVTIVVNY